MKEKLRIVLTTEDQRGWDILYLPISERQIHDAKERIIGGAAMEAEPIEILPFEALPHLNEWRLDGTSVEELNYLARRLESLADDKFLIYRALFQHFYGTVDEDDLLSVKDLINMTYGLDHVITVADIYSDRDLGEFVIENDLNPYVAEMPEIVITMLDHRKVGAIQRDAEGGILLEGHYVVAGDYELKEIYDGRHIPLCEDDTEAEDETENMGGMQL